MSVAVDLPVVMARLRARLREAIGTETTGLTLSQLAILSRLIQDGPSTAAVIAAGEHVSQQAIAQSLVGLKSAGLIRTEPDPLDGRKRLLSVTPGASALIEEMTASRDAWLVRAIDATFDRGEQAELARAIELLARLADAAT